MKRMHIFEGFRRLRTRSRTVLANILLTACGCAVILATVELPVNSQNQNDTYNPNGNMMPQQGMSPGPAPRAPLQGGVEQTGFMNGVQNNGLRGGAQNSTLYGGANGAGNWQGNQQRGMIDQQNGSPLQGGASQNPLNGNVQGDPDVGSQELQIDWDRWRNNLKESVERNTLTNINVHNDVNFVWDQRARMMLSRYPNGISTYYHVDVLPNRRVVNITILQSSHYPGFDKAVIDSINQLQGSPMLAYPPGSRRQIVPQESYVGTAGSTQIQDVKFGDTETQRR